MQHDPYQALKHASTNFEEMESTLDKKLKAFLEYVHANPHECTVYCQPESYIHTGEAIFKYDVHADWSNEELLAYARVEDSRIIAILDANEPGDKFRERAVKGDISRLNPNDICKIAVYQLSAEECKLYNIKTTSCPYSK